MKKIRDVLEKLYYDNLRGSLINTNLDQAMLSIKKMVEGFAFEHECEQGKKYIILLDDIAKLFEVRNESEGKQ